MNTYTIAVVDISNGSINGTHYVTSLTARNVEEAKAEAVTECAENWGKENSKDDDLWVLWVAEGSVSFLEYDEPFT